jgi:Membrane proteins related to metalloendopeptidases
MSSHSRGGWFRAVIARKGASSTIGLVLVTSLATGVGAAIEIQDTTPSATTMVATGHTRVATVAEVSLLQRLYRTSTATASPVVTTVSVTDVTAENDVTLDQAIVVSTPPTAGKSMLYPVNAAVTSNFGFRIHPIGGDWRLHAGTDFGAPCGTPVVAAKGGTVTSTGVVSGYGLRIALDHGVVDGVRLGTTYNHLSVIGVRPGQAIKAGDPIGRVGSTGNSTGCHLHFEVTLNGAHTDPMPFLDGMPSKGITTVPVVMTATSSPSASTSPSVSASATPTSSSSAASPSAPSPAPSTPAASSSPPTTPIPSASFTQSPTPTTSPTATTTPSPPPTPTSTAVP